MNKIFTLFQQKNQSFWEYVSKHPKLRHILFIIFIFVRSRAAFRAIRLLLTIIRKFRYKNLLQTRYSKGSWVVITGGSRGIGKEFCLQFAKLGFNIYAISNIKKDLNVLSEEINQQNLHIQIITSYFDFSKFQTEKSAEFQDLQDELKQLDVSILVNNVGINIQKEFEKLTYDEQSSILHVNCLSAQMMTTFLLPQLKQRNKPGAIINISSYSSVQEQPVPFYQIYSATKAFLTHFSKQLQFQFRITDKNKLHCLCMIPGRIDTQLLNNREKQPGFDLISPQQLVECTLKDLIDFQQESVGDMNQKFALSMLNLAGKILGRKRMYEFIKRNYY